MSGQMCCIRFFILLSTTQKIIDGSVVVEIRNVYLLQCKSADTSAKDSTWSVFLRILGWARVHRCTKGFLEKLRRVCVCA